MENSQTANTNHIGFSDYYKSLGRYVVYYPSLVTLTGTLNSTILLSYFLGWDGKQSDPDGWIFKTAEEISIETGLTPDEQVTARKKLKRLNLLEEKFSGVPRKLFYRLKTEELNILWEKTQLNQHNAIFPDSIIGKNRNQYSGKTGINNPEKPDSSTTTTTTSSTTTTTHQDHVVVPCVSDLSEKKHDEIENLPCRSGKCRDGDDDTVHRAIEIFNSEAREKKIKNKIAYICGICRRGAVVTKSETDPWDRATPEQRDIALEKARALLEPSVARGSPGSVIRTAKKILLEDVASNLSGGAIHRDVAKQRRDLIDRRKENKRQPCRLPGIEVP